MYNLKKHSRLDIELAALRLSRAYESINIALAGLLDCTVISVCSHADAPCTLDGMRKAVLFHGELKVSAEGGAGTLYGTLGNWNFRAMHDLGHVLYNKTVSSKDEKSLSIKLWRSLIKPVLKLSVSPSELLVCRDLYFADTYGQTLYYEQHSAFVPDQTQFILELLCKQAAPAPVCLSETLSRVVEKQ